MALSLSLILISLLCYALAGALRELIRHLERRHPVVTDETTHVTTKTPDF